jgi:hypothetical protein
LRDHLLDWIGDIESETGGRIGLWKICERNEMSDVCIGKLEDVLEMPTMSSQLATIFAGTAVATSLLTILCLVFMIFLKSTTVFHLCGWMQILSGKSYVYVVILKRKALDYNLTFACKLVVIKHAAIYTIHLKIIKQIYNRDTSFNCSIFPMQLSSFSCYVSL